LCLSCRARSTWYFVLWREHVNVRRSPGKRFPAVPCERFPDTVRLRQVRAAGQCGAGDAQLTACCSSCKRSSYSSARAGVDAPAPPPNSREISDFDGHWKLSSPAARRCETPCGEEYCCLGRRAKKSDTFVGRCAKCTPGCADLATLDFRVLLAMDACLLPRTKCGGRGAATLAADRVALARAVAFTAFLQPIPSPPLSCRHAHLVIISDAQCGRAYIRPLCELCGACSEVELFLLSFLLSNRSEKACTRLKFSCGAPPHAPGSV